MKYQSFLKHSMCLIAMLIANTVMYAQKKISVDGNVNNLPVREYSITLREATVNKA